MKMKRNFSLEENTANLIDTIAAKSRLGKGAIVDIAIERLVANSPEFAALVATTPKRSAKKNKPITEVAA